ncbi:Ctr copper transporter family-domain-containing protein [Tricladium varicosporioides]|nr:Ctr copper transporter family-domain-containing protein [Hymenoscyphus varicosporioides]
MDMSMLTTPMDMSTSTIAMVMPTALPANESPASMAMPMGGGSDCKLSMLLNWHTIDACFLSSAFRIRSSFGFFLACLAAFLLVISLESIRRLQRRLDRYLKLKKASNSEQQYVMAEDLEQKLLGKDERESPFQKKRIIRVSLEQIARGVLHTVQFSISYCIMLLFMYSNGYIIISILFGALVGFALFTRDTLYSSSDVDERLNEKDCC